MSERMTVHDCLFDMEEPLHKVRQIGMLLDALSGMAHPPSQERLSAILALIGEQLEDIAETNLALWREAYSLSSGGKP